MQVIDFYQLHLNVYNLEVLFKLRTHFWDLLLTSVLQNRLVVDAVQVGNLLHLLKLDLLEFVGVNRLNNFDELLRRLRRYDWINWRINWIAVIVEFEDLISDLGQSLILKVEVLLNELVHLLLIESSYSSNTVGSDVHRVQVHSKFVHLEPEGIFVDHLL